MDSCSEQTSMMSQSDFHKNAGRWGGSDVATRHYRAAVLSKTGNGARTITCRNRHCPKCQGAAAREWLAEREAELLPVPHFHVVFSLPAQIADIAHQNKAAIYDILFKASAETMLTIAADPKHLGARIGILSVLHTWGSALTQNPHSRYRALSSP